jgi:hypothetical protein
MHHTCWLSSSTTSMAPPRMFSTTFDACTVSSLLVRRSEDEGRSTVPMRRMTHVLTECATESQWRYVM